MTSWRIGLLSQVRGPLQFTYSDRPSDVSHQILGLLPTSSSPPFNHVFVCLLFTSQYSSLFFKVLRTPWWGPSDPWSEYTVLTVSQWPFLLGIIWLSVPVLTKLLTYFESEIRCPNTMDIDTRKLQPTLTLRPFIRYKELKKRVKINFLQKEIEITLY